MADHIETLGTTHELVEVLQLSAILSAHATSVSVVHEHQATLSKSLDPQQWADKKGEVLAAIATLVLYH